MLARVGNLDGGEEKVRSYVSLDPLVRLSSWHVLRRRGLTLIHISAKDCTGDRFGDTRIRLTLAEPTLLSHLGGDNGTFFDQEESR